MSRYHSSKVFFVIIVIFTAFNFCFAEEAKIETDSPVAVVFSAERKGAFLSEPGNVPLEFLRRIGREINKNWPSDENTVSAASVFSLDGLGTPDFLKPKSFINLSIGQKKQAQAILDRFASETDELLQEVKPNEKCIFLRAVAETAPLKDIFKNLSEKEELSSKLRAGQVEKIRTQILPMLEASDYILCAAVLTEKGFEARLRIRSLESKLSNPKINHSITISRFINPQSLMAFAQTHPIENPADVMNTLAAIPQTGSVISMIASAGLDMERDLVANSARESIFYFNFSPTGEGGFPDARFVAPVPDIKKLESNLEKLKNLCVQMGIFVKVIENEPKLVRLSYFMFPQYGLYAGLIDEFLVTATSQENLIQEINFIRDVKSGKATGEKIDSDLQRYWRISFKDFNLQLQKFLQSPLMKDRGIPPISNLTLLDDLGALKMLTRMQPDKIDFSVFLPVKETKESK